MNGLVMRTGEPADGLRCPVRAHKDHVGPRQRSSSERCSQIPSQMKLGTGTPRVLLSQLRPSLPGKSRVWAASLNRRADDLRRLASAPHEPHLGAGPGHHDAVPAAVIHTGRWDCADRITASAILTAAIASLAVTRGDASPRRQRAK